MLVYSVEGMHSPQFVHAHRTQHVVTTRVRILEHSFVYVFIFQIVTVLVSRSVRTIVLLIELLLFSDSSPVLCQLHDLTLLTAWVQHEDGRIEDERCYCSTESSAVWPLCVTDYGGSFLEPRRKVVIAV